MTPLYIFDLDGTLALCDHRIHYLKDESDPARWRKFYAACPDDTPNRPVIDTMTRLFRGGSEILIFSGRSDEVRPQTERWLNTHLYLKGIQEDREIIRDILIMRPEGDHTPDEKLKRKWYIEWLGHRDRERLVAVFDDRDKVVKMWRDLGVTCFQVAPGEF